MWDFLITDGMVVDGSGGPARVADVAIQGDRISAVAERLPPESARVHIDAAHHTVCPGFIDIHTHSDLAVLRWPRGDSKLAQGVTTETIGNCGFSPFPISADRVDENVELMVGVGSGQMTPTWDDLASYERALVSNGTALNVAALVGHGALRTATMGFDARPAEAHELSEMVRHLERALDQGAVGMSTGRTYVPSRYGSDEEIVELAGVLRRRNALYATHSTDGPGFESYESSLETAYRSGVKLQHSHAAINNPALWGRASDVLAMFEQASAAGVDVAYDVYPYDASSTLLLSFVPDWAQRGGWEEMRQRLSDDAAFRLAEAEFSEGFFGGIAWHWDRIIVCACPGAPELVGRSISEIAEDRRQPGVRAALELCVEYGPQLMVVMFYRSADDVAEFVGHDLATLGSDGLAYPIDMPAGFRPHPRSFGAHARLLARYVRESSRLTLERAISMMTSQPAARLGIVDRGRLEQGLAADVVVFDPAAVTDTATFADPCQRAIGVRDVFVNGKHAIAAGVTTGALGGRLVRPRSW